MINLEINKLKCPYCFGEVIGSLQGCRCGVIYHSDCFQALAQCVSCFQNFQNSLPDPITKIPSASSKIPLKNQEFTEEHLKIFIGKILDLYNFNEAYSIAQANAKGPVYLVGGKVYRTIIDDYYGYPTDHLNCDFDFLTQKLTWFRHIPDQWKVQNHSYDGYGSRFRSPYEIKKVDQILKFSRKVEPNDFYDNLRATGCSIDLIPISKLDGIISTGLPATLDGYLQSVPLNLQAVIFDVEQRKLFGPGLKAIASQKILTNHQTNAEEWARRSQKNLETLIFEKILSLGFDVKVYFASRFPLE